MRTYGNLVDLKVPMDTATLPFLGAQVWRKTLFRALCRRLDHLLPVPALGVVRIAQLGARVAAAVAGDRRSTETVAAAPVVSERQRLGALKLGLVVSLGTGLECVLALLLVANAMRCSTPAVVSGAAVSAIAASVLAVCQRRVGAGDVVPERRRQREPGLAVEPLFVHVMVDVDVELARDVHRAGARRGELRWDTGADTRDTGTRTSIDSH